MMMLLTPGSLMRVRQKVPLIFSPLIQANERKDGVSVS